MGWRYAAGMLRGRLLGPDAIHRGLRDGPLFLLCPHRGMDKIASPQDLAAAIHRLITECRGPGRPSRSKIASELRSLADRVAWGRMPTMPRDSYVPKHIRGDKPHVPEGTDLAVWSWEENGKYYGIAFQGKSNKPLWHYAFRSKSERQRQIDESTDSRRATLKRKEDRRKERREFQHGLEVGQVLYASWGYDQTNVDFYEVTAVKGKMVVVREIAAKTVRSDQTSDYVAPSEGRYIGKPLRRRPGGSGNNVYVKIDSVRSATPYKGKPVYQTNPMFGH